MKSNRVSNNLTQLRYMSGNNVFAGEIAEHARECEEVRSKLSYDSHPFYCFSPEKAQDLSKFSNVKRVYLVRHGQGEHNLAAENSGRGCTCSESAEEAQRCPYKDETSMDARLTALGRQQADDLDKETRNIPPEKMPETIIVSPLARAVETATRGFSTLSQANNIPYVADEGCRERFGLHVCDKRRKTAESKELFSNVDFSGIHSEEDTMWQPDRETAAQCGERAMEFVKRLMKREEKTLAVVCHSAFLMNLMNVGFLEVDPAPLKRWFQTGEMREVIIAT